MGKILCSFAQVPERKRTPTSSHPNRPEANRALGFKPRRLRSSNPSSPTTSGAEKPVKMFLGSIPRRPSKEAAYKELKTHLAIMASCVVVIRAAPYVLHFLTRDGASSDVKLDF
ncbi:hypothetical protein EJB05_05598, partial [Eragrostis curvula]